MNILVGILAGIVIGLLIHALLFRRKLLEKVQESGVSTLTPELIQDIVERALHLNELGKKTDAIVDILDRYINSKPGTRSGN